MGNRDAEYFAEALEKEQARMRLDEMKDDRIASLQAELAAERERAAGLAAALHGLVSYFDDPAQAEKYDEQERLDAARQSLSASGFEVVKGWLDPHARGEWWVHENKPTTGYFPCHIVTFKEVKP